MAAWDSPTLGVPNAERVYRELARQRRFERLSTDDALGFLGTLIDISEDLRRRSGLRRAIRLAAKLRTKPLSPRQSALLHYFSANAWASIRHLLKARAALWRWRYPALEHEIIHLRSALSDPGFEDLEAERRCQILTNLANALDHLGRPIEAIDYWDQALSLAPKFGMAIGNRGLGLKAYANYLYDHGHGMLMLRAACYCLASGAFSDAYPSARRFFWSEHQRVRTFLDHNDRGHQLNLDDWSLGRSGTEKEYRRWCLNNRLFLNPLNDLGSLAIAARDIMTAPSVTTPLHENPFHIYGITNQLKQEFCHARVLLFESVTATKPHFADRDVRLYNTLDYPAYGMSIEKLRTSFRLSYALFDKIAFFLNGYFDLHVDERRVWFKSIWHHGEDRKRGLKRVFTARPNGPLRGLYWLSRDLYEQGEFHDALLPAGRRLAEIRNHLEHKYLKVHDEIWAVPAEGTPEYAAFVDKWAFSLTREELEEKALGLLKLARAALIYLFLAIHVEEQRRSPETRRRGVVLPSPLWVYPDRSKL